MAATKATMSSVKKMAAQSSGENGSKKVVKPADQWSNLCEYARHEMPE